ncbi:MAG: TOBE domain-containing protein [Actinomycetota bacterium]|nr:TOBE domain-containing protein [Actinomycetota bacterium]
MAIYRVTESAEVLGVSDDTLRRWADQGRVRTTTTATGSLGIEGRDLADLAAARAGLTPDPDADEGTGRRDPGAATSARNRLSGIVTAVTRDTVMAQVEMVCGPFRVVSLMSREAADALRLEPGVLADAVVKATTVVVETATVRPR